MNTESSTTKNHKKGNEMTFEKELKKFINKSYNEYMAKHYIDEKSPVYNCKVCMSAIISCIAIKIQQNDYDEEVLREVSVIISQAYMEVLEGMMKGQRND